MKALKTCAETECCVALHAKINGVFVAVAAIASAIQANRFASHVELRLAICYLCELWIRLVRILAVVALAIQAPGSTKRLLPKRTLDSANFGRAVAESVSCGVNQRGTDRGVIIITQRCVVVSQSV